MEEKISVEEFMRMFMAVSYLSEQRCVNVDNLREYIKISFVLNEDLERIINNEMYESIAKMCEEGSISHIPCFKYLIKINDNYPFMDIIQKKYGYLEKMKKFLCNFISYSFLENRYNIHLKDEEIDPFDIHENYVKKKTV